MFLLTCIPFWFFGMEEGTDVYANVNEYACMGYACNSSESTISAILSPDTYSYFNPRQRHERAEIEVLPIYLWYIALLPRNELDALVSPSQKRKYALTYPLCSAHARRRWDVTMQFRQFTGDRGGRWWCVRLTSREREREREREGRDVCMYTPAAPIRCNSCCSHKLIVNMYVSLGISTSSFMVDIYVHTNI